MVGGKRRAKRRRGLPERRHRHPESRDPDGNGDEVDRRGHGGGRREPGSTARLGIAHDGDGRRRRVERFGRAGHGGVHRRGFGRRGGSRARRGRGRLVGFRRGRLGGLDLDDRVGPVIDCRRRGGRRRVGKDRLRRRLCRGHLGSHWSGVRRLGRGHGRIDGGRRGLGGSLRGSWSRVAGRGTGTAGRRHGRLGHGRRGRRRRLGLGRGGRGGVGAGCGGRGHERRHGRLRRGRRHRGGKRRNGARRQQRQRIDVALRLGGDANAQAHGRIRRLGGRAHRADRGAFGDDRAARHRDRSEVDQRDRVAVGRRDRDDAPAVRHRPRKGDRTACGRQSRLADRAPDVDAAMLPAGVRMRRVEGEGTEHGPAGRPRPGACGWSGAERERKGEQQHGTTHRATSVVVRLVNEATTVAAVWVVVKSDYSELR
jgi:hypothetical protein